MFVAFSIDDDEGDVIVMWWSLNVEVRVAESSAPLKVATPRRQVLGMSHGGPSFKD